MDQGNPALAVQWDVASILVGNNVKKLRAAFRKEMKSARSPRRPELWDGRTAERIAKLITAAK